MKWDEDTSSLVCTCGSTEYTVLDNMSTVTCDSCGHGVKQDKISQVCDNCGSYVINTDAVKDVASLYRSLLSEEDIKALVKEHIHKNPFNCTAKKFDIHLKYLPYWNIEGSMLYAGVRTSKRYKLDNIVDKGKLEFEPKYISGYDVPMIDFRNSVVNRNVEKELGKDSVDFERKLELFPVYEVTGDIFKNLEVNSQTGEITGSIRKSISKVMGYCMVKNIALGLLMFTGLILSGVLRV